MNNNNPSKLLLQQNQINEGTNNPTIKNYNPNIERNTKPKFDLNLSDYFKLIEHKKEPHIMKRKIRNIALNRKSESNRSHRSISHKSYKSNNSYKSNKSNKKSIKSNNSKKSSDKKINKKESNNNIDKKENKDNSRDLVMNNLKKDEPEKIFNKRLNKQKMIKSKLPSTNNTTVKKAEIKKLIRNMSCKNFNNTKLKKNYNLEELKLKSDENEEITHDIGKYNISTKYFERVKFNKYKYYNDRNNYYIDTRRQRIEDYLNKELYEKYKVLKPLRTTERIFYKEEDEKTTKEQNDINISNNLFYSDYNRKNNVFKIINNYLFNESSNYNKCNKNIMKNKNLKMYYQKVKQISNSRRDLLTSEFFDGIKRRNYNLLDFNFSFLYKKNKGKNNK